MVDPFYSSRRRLARAKHHIADLERQVKAFVESEPYATVTEPDPQAPNHQLHKIKLVKPFPETLDDIAVDAVDNLRAALDKAGYGIAVASGKTRARYTNLSVARTKDFFLKHGRGWAKDLPEEIFTFYCNFKPYKGGNDLLWALNEICNGNKHAILAPVGLAIGGSFVRNLQVTGFFRLPVPKWDAAKNEVTLIQIGPNTKFKYDLGFSLFVAFGDVEIVGGKPAITVLNDFMSVVEGLLIGLEAETRRLFPGSF